MALDAGEEFNIIAAPSQEMMRKLAYLAQQGNDSVLTGALESPQHIGADARSSRGDKFIESVQLLSMEEQRREQMRQLSDRLDQLDRASERAMREAQAQLDEMRRNANRTKDGRLAFEAEDGTIYDEHGNEVQEDEIDRDRWNQNGPTWEAWKQGRERFDAAVEHQRKVEEAKERLGSDLTDEDLDDLEARIARLEAGAPADTAPAAEPAAADGGRSTSAAKTYDDAPADGSARLQPLFGGAVAGDAPATDHQPDAGEPKPASPLTPN